MAHMLLIGQTEAGKTHLAVTLAQKYLDEGRKVFVLDSSFNAWPIGAHVSSTMDEFVRITSNARNAALFVDEAGEAIGTYDKDNLFIATKFRHFGHWCHFISQRYKSINSTVRAQCSYLALFAVSKDDALEAAADFSCDALKNANTLKRREYMFCDRYGKLLIKKEK